MDYMLVTQLGTLKGATHAKDPTRGLEGRAFCGKSPQHGWREDTGFIGCKRCLRFLLKEQEFNRRHKLLTETAQEGREGGE